MELNLLPILNFDGKKMQICENVLLEASKNDTFRFLSPVHFEGEAVNNGGTISLIGCGTVGIELMCDRCTKAFEETIVFELDELLKKEDEFSSGEENPDAIVFSGTSVDFDEILYTNFYMTLPSKTLCSEECKGLCTICGKNLNHGDCNCSANNTDPRFDILDKLL